MRAIQIIDGTPQLVHRKAAAPGGDTVRVRVAAASICGSDLHMIARGWAEGLVLGHEFAGHTPDGTPVAVEPLFGCGGCHYCEDGYPSHCESGPTLVGISITGGMAEFVDVPAATLVRLPGGLPVTDASLVEPLAVAVHGIEQARVRAGERVLVVGAGAIGLAVAAVLRGRGQAFDMVARHPHQQTAAAGLGAGLEPGDGYDVVLDAVGSTASLEDAVARVRPRGRIGLLGSFWEPASLALAFCMKEIELLPSMTYRCGASGRSFEEAVSLLAAARDIPERLVSHRFPLEGAAEAFQVAGDRASGAIKVCFDV